MTKTDLKTTLGHSLHENLFRAAANVANANWCDFERLPRAVEIKISGQNFRAYSSTGQLYEQGGAWELTWLQVEFTVEIERYKVLRWTANTFTLLGKRALCVFVDYFYRLTDSTKNTKIRLWRISKQKRNLFSWREPSTQKYVVRSLFLKR